MVLNPRTLVFGYYPTSIGTEIYCLKGLHAFLKLLNTKKPKQFHSYQVGYWDASFGFDTVEEPLRP
jgi:hypothetical protein